MTVFSVSVIGTMHIFNRIFSYIASENNLLDENKYDYYEWRFGKLLIQKKAEGLPFY